MTNKGSPVPDNASPVLDHEQVAELRALDRGQGALLAKFVGLFLNGTPKRITAIKTHCVSGDLAELAEAAHALRGAAGNVGATRLSGLLERIEVASKGQDQLTSTQAVALLDPEYLATEDALLAACRTR